MPNPEEQENLNTPELSKELSEKKEATTAFQKEIADLEDDLPKIGKEAEEPEWYEEFKKNPEEVWSALKEFFNESQKMFRPIENLWESIRKAIESWELKLSAEELNKADKLLKVTFINIFQSHIDLIKRNNESGEYYINPDDLLAEINKALDKEEDRELVNKIMPYLKEVSDKKNK